MLTPKSAAILGSSPIITNSVVPMARPPSASGKKCFFTKNMETGYKVVF
jgi:hypothetical protein